MRFSLSLWGLTPKLGMGKLGSGTGSNSVLAFQSFPLILVISAPSVLLFHWNIVQPIVRAFAWALRRAIGIDGPPRRCGGEVYFFGMVEAPLVVKPYLRAESRTGLFVFMTAGTATAAGTMMVPERRNEIVELAPKALISGTLTTCMSGAMVGLLTWG